MAQPPERRMRLDDLAQRTGTPTTTIRLYQTRGLLPPPELVGRTGYYDGQHVERLELIGRLQEQGFSLAAIGTVLERWEAGATLDDLLASDDRLGGLLPERREVVLTVEELLARFPEGALDADQIQRAAALGLVEATDDGSLRVPDTRFLDTGSALMELGVPNSVVLDEWEALARLTDEMAERFASLFEAHVLPADWREHLDGDATSELAATLSHLRVTGERVVLAALDASIRRVATERFSEILDGG